MFQTKESGTGPFRAGDLAGDVGEAPVFAAAIFKGVKKHEDAVFLAIVFPREDRSFGRKIPALFIVGLGFFSQLPELLPRFVRQTAVGQLLKNKARAEDIADHFEVALKTAKRDIEGLKDGGKIRFVGARKTGRYEIIE